MAATSMPPDQPERPQRLAPDDPHEWLNRAHGNLRRAHVVSPDFYLEDLWFDARQATENPLKAVLLARNIVFPFTHDLAQLIPHRRSRRDLGRAADRDVMGADSWWCVTADVSGRS